jgi:hypothetical protein
MNSQDFLFGLVAGLFLFFIVSKMVGQKSTFTMTPFTGTDANAVKTSFQTQTQQIATELQQALRDGITQGKTKDELVTISNTYNDQSCALTKAYAEWNIRNVSASAPGPSPAAR